MNITKKLLSIFLITGQLLVFFSASAGSLVHVTDTVSTSVTATPANHLIKFFTVSQIPIGGKIVIIPEEGKFDIPIDLDYTDVDLAVSASESEEYIDRSLAPVADGMHDGVSVVGGMSGKITITLDSAGGINPGSNVKISIGANAIFEDNGEEQIINPVNLGPHKFSVATFDENNNSIDNTTTVIFTTESVKMTAYQEKIRSGGKPTKDDILVAGTLITIMSMSTNYKAWCRYVGVRGTEYEVASTTPFTSMTDSFANSGEYYHSVFLMSLPAGMWHYYVRCIDMDGVMDSDSYLIEFRMAASGSGESGEGENNTDNGTGTGGGAGDTEGAGSRSGGSGGGSGRGSGGGGGSGSGELQPYPAPLAAPDVVLKGWAFPGSKVTILRDGKEEKILTANEKAEFSIDINGLNKGVYTFGVFAKDSDGLQSETYSTTAWINEGTKTTVSEIFIAPSMKLDKTSVSSGEIVPVSGQGVPDSTIEVYLYSAKNLNPTFSQMTKQEAKVGANGHWNLNFATTGLPVGEYKIKVRSNLALVGYSPFGKILNIGIGVAAGEDKNYKRADLNKDGKVNLLDFSIMLYYWGTAQDLPDLNSDKKVNLIDFSMMMYEWTG